MKKKYVWVAGVVAAVCGLSYPRLFPGAFNHPAENMDSKQVDGGSRSQEEAWGSDITSNALRVAVYKVEPTEFIETISSTGTVRADESVELQAETNGKVVSLNFHEGASVKKGDLLVKLNDSDLQANLERYRYAKELSEVRFRRISELMKQKVVSHDEYDAALNEVKIQESFIALYQAEIKKTEIQAPFDGVVGLRYLSIGAYVSATTRIATLQRLDALKIDFSVPERYAGRIAVGGKVHFTVAGAIKQYEGEIYAIDPRIDVGTRTLLVRAVYPNADSSLLPGAFTNVTVELEKFPNAVLVPAEAVIPGVDKKVVYSMRNGIAEMLAVETGMRTSTHVHILSGLQAGDLVITSGLQQIRDGLPVQLLPKSRVPSKSRDTAVQGKVTTKSDPGDLEPELSMSVHAVPFQSTNDYRRKLA